MKAQTPGKLTCGARKGPRYQQEDRHYYHAFPDGNWFLAVMDGHNGDKLSEFCRKWFTTEIPAQTFSHPEEDLRQLIARLADATKEMNAGTTLSAAWVATATRTVTVAILGDSPLWIIGAETLWQAPEHNVRTNATERAAAESRGGVYGHGGYICTPDEMSGLQMSRALGDKDMGAIILREPEIFTLELPPQAIVLVASDGVLDPAHGDTTAVEEVILSTLREGKGAKALLNRLEARGLDDNATALVLRL